jgi:hypothetical protein
VKQKKQNKEWFAATSAVCDSLEFLVSTACPHHVNLFARFFSFFVRAILTGEIF